MANLKANREPRKATHGFFVAVPLVSVEGFCQVTQDAQTGAALLLTVCDSVLPNILL